MANRQKVNLVGRFYNESCILLNYLRMTPQEHFVLFFVFVFFVLLAAPKKKTNRKNFGRDTATAVANYSGPRY